MELQFEWDPGKAESNLRKHGVSFQEAATTFGDPLSVTVPDPRHSQEEERYFLFGRSGRGRYLAVMHTERHSKVRIVSARLMTAKERREYEDGAI